MSFEPLGGAPVPSAVRITLLLGLLGLAACQSQPKATRDYAEFRSDEQPVAVAMRIADNVRACWFAGGRPAFAQYSYAPELTSYSNRPRVLVVPKSDPGGLPKLVIEASKARDGTSVKLFGPLMASPESAAISRDVARWVNGATGC
jgi:hypothetical protein